MIECIDKDTATVIRYRDDDCTIPISNYAIEEFLALEVNVEGLEYDVTCCTGNTCAYISHPDTIPFVVDRCFASDSQDEPYSLKFTNCTMTGNASLDYYDNGDCSGNPIISYDRSDAECGQSIDTC